MYITEAFVDLTTGNTQIQATLANNTSQNRSISLDPTSKLINVTTLASTDGMTSIEMSEVVTLATECLDGGSPEAEKGFLCALIADMSSISRTAKGN